MEKREWREGAFALLTVAGYLILVLMFQCIASLIPSARGNEGEKKTMIPIGCRELYPV